MKADLLRSDLTEGLVWFVNYAALDPSSVKVSDLDLHGCGMLPHDVELFAHRWLTTSRSVDIEHDGVGRPIQILESFFNSKDVAAQAWPINSHAVRFNVASCKEAMDGLREGSLNSVSLDAFTFNKVIRVPVAQAKSALGIKDPFVTPDTAMKWAEELARDGYPGVTSVRSVGENMFIADRESGLPLAITVKDGLMEASAAGGPWAHIGMALMSSPSLTNNASLGVEGSEDAQIAPNGSVITWDPEVVNRMMEDFGVMAPDLQGQAIQDLIGRLQSVQKKVE